MRTHNRQVTALRINRIAADLRLADVADEIDRSVMFVQRLETNGYARLTPEISEKIASVLGCNVTDLFGEVADR